MQNSFAMPLRRRILGLAVSAALAASMVPAIGLQTAYAESADTGQLGDNGVDMTFVWPSTGSDSNDVIQLTPNAADSNASNNVEIGVSFGSTSGSVDSDAAEAFGEVTLSVKSSSDAADKKAVSGSESGTSNTQKTYKKVDSLYDIALTGKETDVAKVAALKPTYTVTLKLSEEAQKAAKAGDSIKVYWVKDDNNLEQNTSAKLVNDKSSVTFTTDHFSTWAVAIEHTHNYTSTVTKAATCTTKGTTKYTCKSGDYTYSSDNIAALGHSWNSGTVTTAATSTTTGTKTYTCTRDSSHTKTSTIAKLAEGTDYVKMYRLYNASSGEHLFTTNTDEYSYLVKIGWKGEGFAWNCATSGTKVYRLYNPNSGDHHYTKNLDEYNYLQTLGWRGEGVKFYSADSTNAAAQEVYRLFNPNEQVGTHLYTLDANEYKDLGIRGWRQEGVGFYSIK